MHVSAKLLFRRAADVNVVNKANKTAAQLASENAKSPKTEVARLMAEYNADANSRNEIRPITLDAAQYGADGDGKEPQHRALCNLRILGSRKSALQDVEIR